MRGVRTRHLHIGSLRSASASTLPVARRLASSARMHERRRLSGNRLYRLGDGWLTPRTAAAAAATA